MDNASCTYYNASSSTEDELLITYYHGVSKALRLYVTPVIIFGGTLGNVLTIIVVLSHHFRYSPSSIPLITLACVDIGVLYFNLLDVWLGALLGYSLQYLRDISSAGCKISTYVTVFLTQYSSWILVLINIERVLSVYKPMKARNWCSRRRLVMALVLILLILAVVSLHLFWTTKYHPDRASDRCQYNEVLLGEHGHTAWLIIDASLFTFVPFTVILCCNVAIIHSLIHAKKRRQRHYHVRNHQASDSTKSITTMLLTISVVFLITTSPLTVCYQFNDDLMQHFHNDPVAKALWYDLVINTVLVLLCYSNNAVNCWLYCISGSKFRVALVQVLGGGGKNRGRYQYGRYPPRSLRMSMDNIAQSSFISGMSLNDKISHKHGTLLHNPAGIIMKYVCI